MNKEVLKDSIPPILKHLTDEYPIDFVLSLKSLQKILYESHCVWNPENQDNLCVWYCLAKALFKPKNKAMIVSKAKELMSKFYNIPLGKRNSRTNEINKFVKNYQGFNVIEYDDLANKFDLHITIYSYQFNIKNSYYEKLDEYNKKGSFEINLLQIMDEFENHCALITNLDKLLGSWVCPRCKSHVIFYSPNIERDKQKHLDKCSDKAKISFDSEPVPYIPQFTKNKLYAYCFAHNLHYEPIKYYITYDF